MGQNRAMSSKRPDPNSCPCQSGQSLEECCGRYLDGGQQPPTAEALMRSRYTAYSLGNVDHILATTHPDKRPELKRDSIESWAAESEWLGFEVVATQDGAANDETGEVEFVAYYETAEGPVTHRERSTFSKLDGRWYFVDGEMIKQRPVVRDHPKVGRNDPCPCGSGRKFKKCCGA
jgi:SEC-C motif-containing protein